MSLTRNLPYAHVGEITTNHDNLDIQNKVLRPDPDYLQRGGEDLQPGLLPVQRYYWHGMELFN
jgi:hypothetical protein